MPLSAARERFCWVRQSITPATGACGDARACATTSAQRGATAAVRAVLAVLWTAAWPQAASSSAAAATTRRMGTPRLVAVDRVRAGEPVVDGCIGAFAADLDAVGSGQVAGQSDQRVEDAEPARGL